MNVVPDSPLESSSGWQPRRIEDTDTKVIKLVTDAPAKPLRYFQLTLTFLPYLLTPQLYRKAPGLAQGAL